MAAMSLNEGNVVPTLVGARVENAAKGAGMSGGKRAASQSSTKSRISANLDERQRGPGRLVRNGPGVVAAATRVSCKPHAIGKMTRSGGKAANEVSGAMSLNCPVGRLVTVRADTPVRARNASDELLDYVPSKCKEAGGVQDNFIHEDNEDEDEDNEDNADNADEDDDEEDIELTLLRREMDALEQCMYSEGTVASVFARTVTNSTLAGNPFGAEAIAAIASIFKGNDNPYPSVVAAALVPSAASTRAYLVVMNNDVGFSVLHHLQRMDQEICPGDPVVFTEAEDTLFKHFHLPTVRLAETHARYRSRADGNDQLPTFMVDPSITTQVTGAVTRLIPIPLEWAPMFLDGPTFGMAFRRMFDLLDSLEEEDQNKLLPILEMMGMACCAADESDMAPSTLSSQWTRLTHHTRTKEWAAEVWAWHSDPVEQSLSDMEAPTQFPSDQLQGLFGQRRKRLARAASTQARSTPSISLA
jgi:hypothetical protein